MRNAVMAGHDARSRGRRSYRGSAPRWSWPTMRQGAEHPLAIAHLHGGPATQGEPLGVRWPVGHRTPSSAHTGTRSNCPTWMTSGLARLLAATIRSTADPRRSAIEVSVSPAAT